MKRPERWIGVVFGLSGFAALVYQVVWQRSLFAIYGIDAESVAVVVTAFLLGLGLGSLMGGALSRDPGRPVLLMFGCVEIGIGAYGLASLTLFRVVGAATLGAPAVVTALTTFLLVLFPTLLMGATLPLLVAHAVRVSGNVGKSVGSLYFVNTLGSAIASFVVVWRLLGLFGQQGSVFAAAAINLAVGIFVLTRHWAEVRK
jgi:hypothetical protein